MRAFIGFDARFISEKMHEYVIHDSCILVDAKSWLEWEKKIGLIFFTSTVAYSSCFQTLIQKNESQFFLTQAKKLVNCEKKYANKMHATSYYISQIFEETF